MNYQKNLFLKTKEQILMRKIMKIEGIKVLNNMYKNSL